MVWSAGLYQGKLDMSEKIKLQDVITRIQKMEQYFDEVSSAFSSEPEIIYNDVRIQQMVQALADYIDNGQLLQDYECDERGELPADLKRGVLSQDGLYNLLYELWSRDLL